MYHPTRGGVRGGRDQFKWDDVKVDKHRENYLGHSVMAPVGRWQKGKDLTWYSKDNKSKKSDMEAAKEEIRRIKEEEEQAMREALGLAPKRSTLGQGNRLDKHEFSELVKRGSTAEDVGAGHSEAAQVHGLGFTRASRNVEVSSSSQGSLKEVLPEKVPVDKPNPSVSNTKEEPDEEDKYKKQRREEKRHERHEKRREHKKRDSHESEKRGHRKDKKRSRHDSD